MFEKRLKLRWIRFDGAGNRTAAAIEVRPDRSQRLILIVKQNEGRRHA